MRLPFLVFLTVTLCIPCRAQHGTEKTDSLAFEKFLMMVSANREQSYVTFSNGIGNLEPLIMEAKLSPSYFFSRNRRQWAVLLNPQVQVRMLHEKSLPIRNPSYRVFGTFYHKLEFWKHSFLRKLFYDDALWYGSLVHHSNGQDGPFLNDTTQQVNFENGSFAANYLEFGISSYRLEKIGTKYFSIREVKGSFEYYPSSLYSEGLKDRYGSYRIFAKAGIVGPEKKLSQEIVMRWLQRSSLEIKAGWIFGSVEGAGVLEVSDRLIIDLYYKYYPVWFDEVAFFIRFYRGQDYYNIHFAKDEITNISFGVTSNIMNYNQAVKLFR